MQPFFLGSKELRVFPAGRLVVLEKLGVDKTGLGVFLGNQAFRDEFVEGVIAQEHSLRTIGRHDIVDLHGLVIADEIADRGRDRHRFKDRHPAGAMFLF